MKLTAVLTGALATIASAHADYQALKLVGARGFLSEMKARDAIPAPEIAPVSLAQDKLYARQTSDGRCGAGLGSCTNCCSAAGWCGTGSEYCAAPDCQYQYGPQCDANKIPAGSSTASTARPQLGNIAYGGTGIYDCNSPGSVAFTFDDGPYIYTSDLLDKLKVYGAKATFFITGNNLGKGAIDSTPQWSNLIKRMVAEGHQIASHTWSHQDLSTLDLATFNKQMQYNEMAFNNILGYFPTYMRPPYSSCDATCQSRLKTLGYHITYFDLDTEGYLHTTPQTVQTSKNIWDAAIKNANPATTDFLQIEHDIHDQVVHNLTDYILASMYSKGFKSVTVGECLGDPKANWYRAGSGTLPSSASSSARGPSSTSSKPPTSTSKAAQAISTDGSCSSTITCQGSTFGNCCSQYGWCGSTDLYCGEGCKSAAGTCGTVAPVLSSSSSAPPRPASSSTTVSRAVVSSATTTSRIVTPAPTPKVSTDGSCGGAKGFTCTGSRYGKCCSSAGRCGSVGVGSFQPYCGTGCQKNFGVCN